MDKVHVGTFGRAIISAIWLVGALACSRSASDAVSRNSEAGGEVSASTSVDASANFSTLAADAIQVDAGKKLFSNCAVCHSVDPGAPSPAGPQLIGVVGRRVGSVSDFPYSQALKHTDGHWSPERLDEFLKHPQVAYPGTSMAFGGLTKEADRKAIIAYLASIRPK